MKNVIAKLKEIPSNIKAETPAPDKKKRNVSLVIAGLGIGARVALAFTPAAPVALASLASELMYVGLAGLGFAGWFQNKKK